MKKLIIYIILQFLVLSVNSQTYNAIVINENGNKKATVLTNEIDSITFNDEGSQFVWLKDSIYKTSLSTLTSTSFEKIELLEVLVINDSIGDWSEMRIAIDGSVQMIKTKDGDSTPKELLLILPNEDIGTIYSYAIFDDKGMPKTININECVIFVDAYYDEYIDLTVAYNDTITYSVDSVLVNPQRLSAKSILRSWEENNWQRNLAGIIEIASGAAGVTLGSLIVTGSVVSESGSFGASTPISIPGIIAGTVTIRGGLSSIDSGWRKLYSPEENRSNLGETLYYQAAGEIISNGPQNAFVPDKYWAYLKDPNYSNQLGRLGWIDFFAGLFAGLVDNLYGKTITWENIRQYYQGKVITGINKDITANSAIVRGYIYPEITKSLLDGSKVVNEYGIILASSSDSNDRQIHEFINGDGGLIEHCFNNLRPSTSYNYRTYYIDKTNGTSLLGETMTFQTLGAKACISNFKVIHSQYSVGAYYNDGRYYDYKFDVATTVEIDNLDGVEDWGYVYKDPYGNIKRISLMEYGQSYTDTRYAYYRNEAHSTACLYTYVKYEGDSEYYDSEPQDFELHYDEPSPITERAENIKHTAADIICTFKNVPADSECGVLVSWNYGEWTKTFPVTIENSKEETKSIQITGLEPGHYYNYHAYISTKDGAYYEGEDKQFRTTSDPPILTTGGVWGITSSSAKVSCGFKNVTEGMVCGVQVSWNYGESNRYFQCESKDGTHTITLSGLPTETEFWYRAYATDETGFYIDSNHGEFTTY